MARDADLFLASDMPLGLGFQAHVQGVALGQELVQAEREQWPAGHGIGNPCAFLQDRLDRGLAPFGWQPASLRQALGCRGHGHWPLPDEPVRAGLRREAERCLNPAS